MPVENPATANYLPHNTRDDNQTDRIPAGTGLALGVIVGTAIWAVVVGMALS